MKKSQLEIIIDALKFMHPKLGDSDYGVIELMAPGCSGNAPGLWDGFCGGKGIVSGWFSDRRVLVRLANDLDKGWPGKQRESRYAEAIYVTMNPVSADLLARANNRMKAAATRTADENIASYHNIFFDVDAVRPSGISSNREEHDAAITLARIVQKWLRDNLFWPEPMLVDSGNGAHLIYKAYFPNAPENVEVLKSLLTVSKKFFDPQASNGLADLDAVVYNPARLVKLPGTTARKGDPTDTRPHRISNILELPDPKNLKKSEVITVKMMKQAIDIMQQQILGVGEEGTAEKLPTNALAADTQNPSSQSSHPNDNMLNSMSDVAPLKQGGSLKVEKYLQDNNIKIKEVKKHGDAQLYVLERCVFDDTHQGGEAAIGQNADGKLWYQCFHNTCKTNMERRWPQARSIISGAKKLGRWMEGGSFGIEFPNVNQDGVPYARVENFKALLQAYAVTMRYNMMTRQCEYRLSKGLWKAADRLNNLANAFFKELCARHGLSSGRLDDFVLLVSEENTYHPVKDWIESVEWDGISRMTGLADTVEVPKDQQDQWHVYLRKWMVSAVAALYLYEDFESRGVLVFQGDQSIGKTTWFKNLTPVVKKAFGKGQHLDPGNKDSLMTILMRWIVELGELDSTFRKADISRLKAFIDKSEDEIRPPYGHGIEIWNRQTVFTATVNDPTFLVDPTGNARWWVIKTLKFDWYHKIDVQQSWAEAKFMYDTGDTWFLSKKESKIQDAINSEYMVVDPIEEGLYKYFKFDTPKFSWNNYMTTSDILNYIGIRNITKPQATVAGTILTNLCGRSIKTTSGGIAGRYHKMPSKRDMFSSGDEEQPTAKQKKRPADVLEFKPKTDKEEE